MSADCRWTLAGVVALVVTGLTACTDADSDSPVQRTDSAGVEIVSHTGPDRPLDWTFELRFTLGGKESDEESFYQLDRSRIGVDTAGNIYVLDASAHRVVVFDDEGTYLRSMGGEGGGPGEMGFPFALTVSAGGVAGVFDLSKRGFVRFGPRGEVLDELRVTFGYGGGLIREVAGSLIVPIDELDAERGVSIDALLAVTGGDTAYVVSVERPAGGVVTLASCGMQISGMAPVFTPDLRWSPMGMALVVATGTGYDIAVYRHGRLAQVLRRELTPVPATDALALASVGDRMQVVTSGGVRTCDPDEVVEQRGVASPIPMIAALAEGPAGTLWVRRTEGPNTPQPIDVFKPDGTYLGTLPDGSPFPALVIGDRIAAIETDDVDVERLVVYEVVRGES